MSKRFPIPEFDRDFYKNRPWTPPTRLDPAGQQRLRTEPGAPGGYAVEVSPELAARYGFEGPDLQAVLCVLPNAPVQMVGRSWAWPIQRALVLDGGDAATARVIADWTTPRPMNTRLGPAEGIALPGGPVLVLMGHRIGTRWVANRTMAIPAGAVGGQGFEVVSACGEENDFHACNLSFSWR